MAFGSGSTFRFGHSVLQERNRDEIVGKGPEAKRTFMSSANVNLLKQFIDYCRVMKIDLDNEPTEALNGFRYYQEKGAVDLASFREDLNMYFGHQLLPNVVEELCKLVQDSSHGKCSSCMLPTESLIISVLQILSDAAQIGNGSKENCPVPPTIQANATAVKDLSLPCSQHFNMRPPQKCSKDNFAIRQIFDNNVRADGMHGISSLKDPLRTVRNSLSCAVVKLPRIRASVQGL